MSETDRAFIKAYFADLAEAKPLAAPVAAEFELGEPPARDGLGSDGSHHSPLDPRHPSGQVVSDPYLSDVDNDAEADSETPPVTEHQGPTYQPPGQAEFPSRQSARRQRSARPAVRAVEPMTPDTLAYGSFSGDSQSSQFRPAYGHELQAEEDTHREQTFQARRGVQPALEVEHFVWPEACRYLLDSAGQSFDALAGELLHRSQQQQVIVVAGLHRGEGRSTTLLCTALCLAARGAKVALVDADFSRPSLAGQMGVAVELGWEAVLAGRLPLGEVLVRSRADGLTLLPTQTAHPTQTGIHEAGRLPPLDHAAASLDVLRSEYELVLVDAGPVVEPEATAVALFNAGGADAALLVSDARNAAAAQIHKVVGILRSLDVEVLGMVENFLPMAGQWSYAFAKRMNRAA